MTRTYNIITGATDSISHSRAKKIDSEFGRSRIIDGVLTRLDSPKLVHIRREEDALEPHIIFDHRLDFLTFLNRDDLKKFNDSLKKTSARNIENLFEILNGEAREEALAKLLTEVASSTDIDEAFKEKTQSAIVRIFDLSPLINEKVAQNFRDLRAPTTSRKLYTAVGMPASRKSSYTSARISESGEDFALCSLDETRYEFDLYRYYKSEDLKQDDNWTLMEVSKLIRARSVKQAVESGHNINLDASNLPFDEKKFNDFAALGYDITILATLVKKPTIISGNEKRFHNPHQHFVPLDVIEERWPIVMAQQLKALQYCHDKKQSFFLVREFEEGRTAAGAVINFRELSDKKAEEVLRSLRDEISGFYSVPAASPTSPSVTLSTHTASRKCP